MMVALSTQLYFIALPIDLGILKLMQLISCTDKNIRLKRIKLEPTYTHKV